MNEHNLCRKRPNLIICDDINNDVQELNKTKRDRLKDIWEGLPDYIKESTVNVNSGVDIISVLDKGDSNG